MPSRTRWRVGDLVGAIRLIESAGLMIVLNQQIQTALGWIDSLPEVLVRDRPILHTIRGLALVFSNRPDEAEASLRAAERCLSAGPDTDEVRALLGRMAVIRAVTARFSGDLERAVSLGRQALDLLPATDNAAKERTAAKVNVALSFQVSGNVNAADERPLGAGRRRLLGGRSPRPAAARDQPPGAVPDDAGPPQSCSRNLRNSHPCSVWPRRAAGCRGYRRLSRRPWSHPP